MARARWNLTLVLSFTLLISSPVVAATKAVLSYASFNERTAGALLVAEDQGFFRKQDLDARLVYVRTGSVALSALAAGESQFYFGSGTGSTRLCSIMFRKRLPSLAAAAATVGSNCRSPSV